MDAITAIRTRRAVRAFEDRQVERELLAAIIEDAAHAPFTPLAREGAWLFAVLEGRERIRDYGDRALAFARSNRPQGPGYEWTERPGFSVFHGASAIIIVAGREGFAGAREECTRAGQILEIAANARGLGTCWVGAPMLWLSDQDVRLKLGIPTGWMPQAVFAVGYPDRAAVAATPPASRPPVTTLWLTEQSSD